MELFFAHTSKNTHTRTHTSTKNDCYFIFKLNKIQIKVQLSWSKLNAVVYSCVGDNHVNWPGVKFTINVLQK